MTFGDVALVVLLTIFDPLGIVVTTLVLFVYPSRLWVRATACAYPLLFSAALGVFDAVNATFIIAGGLIQAQLVLHLFAPLIAMFLSACVRVLSIARRLW